MYYFYAGGAEELDAAVVFVRGDVNYSFDAGLEDEFAAFFAGGEGEVEGGAFAAEGGACHFHDGIGFGVEHIPEGVAFGIFAAVFKAGRGAVIAIGNDGVVFYDEGSYLFAFTIGEFGPFQGHA